MGAGRLIMACWDLQLGRHAVSQAEGELCSRKGACDARTNRAPAHADGLAGCGGAGEGLWVSGGCLVHLEASPVVAASLQTIASRKNGFLNASGCSADADTVAEGLLSLKAHACKL